eukprot:1157967-Pelagomonas_calceolata.AAC.4
MDLGWAAWAVIWSKALFLQVADHLSYLLNKVLEGVRHGRGRALAYQAEPESWYVRQSQIGQADH